MQEHNQWKQILIIYNSVSIGIKKPNVLIREL